MKILKEQVSTRTPSIIQEGVVFQVPERLKTYNDGKVIFEAILQSADTRNQNKRIYPRDVLDDGLRRIQKQIDDRRFLGELDHPICDNQQRATTVELKNCSHLVRKWWWDGFLIKGELETLPYTESGRTISGMIADNIPVGFSLRALSDVSDENGYQKVVGPMVVISYDAVANPSHSGSQVTSIHQEGKSFIATDSKVLKVLNEAKNLITLTNGATYEANSLDMLIEKKIIQLSKMYI